MRVAYLINSYPKVSHTFIRREILELERQGLEIERFALRGWDYPTPEPLDEIERSKSRYVLRQPVAAMLWSVLSTAARYPHGIVSALGAAIRSMRKTERSRVFHLAYLVEACVIAQWLEERDVDHLHAHFGTNGAQVAMLAHIITGISYSFTMHGSEEWDRPEYLGLPQKVAHASFVAAVSSYTRSQLYRWSAREHWSKIRVVRCGLDGQFLDRPPASSRPSRRFIFVGRLGQYIDGRPYEGKGTSVLLDAVATLAAEGLDFELVFAGDGEGRAQVEAEAVRLQVADRINVTGWVDGRQVLEHLQVARCLVLPSFAEGLPIVITEAFACARPVIATFVGGVPELVEPGRSGWLVPAGSSRQLADAMRQCLQHSDAEIAEMGRCGREKVMQLHDVRTEASRLARLFRQAHAAARNSKMVGASADEYGGVVRGQRQRRLEPARVDD